MKKKLGLYILSYNYSMFLNWALNSIKAQTLQPDVLIFVDDHSTDNSVQLLKTNYSDMKFDEVIVNEQNMGCVHSMNMIVKLLGEKYNCDYICGLSADDTFHPDYLKKSSNVLQKAPLDVGYTYTWVRRIGDENQLDVHPEWNYDLLMKIPYIHGSALIKYEAWKAVNGLPDLPKEEDWAMYRAMAQKGWKGLLIPEPLLRWRKHKLGCRTLGNDKQRGKEANQ